MKKMIDHRSYIHNSFSGYIFATAKVVCVTATINHFFISFFASFIYSFVKYSLLPYLWVLSFYRQ